MSETYPPLIERTEVDGVRVVKDEVLASGLSSAVGKLVPLKGTRVLTLENGEVTYGCADCLTHGTRGEVSQHRATEHPASARKRGPGRPAAAGSKAPAVSPEVMALSLAELLELATLASETEGQFARLEARIAELEGKLVEATTELHAVEKAYATQTNRLKKLVEI